MNIYKYIQQHGYLMDHDICYWSDFMGEPIIFFDEWIGYFDGERLLLYTISIHQYKCIPNEYCEKIWNIYSAKGVKYFEFWGDYIPKMNFKENWTIKEYDLGDEYVGMQINLKDYNILDSKKRRKRIKEYKRNKVECNIVKYDYFPNEYIKLIDSFLENHSIDSFDVSYTQYISNFIHNDEIILLEATYENKIIGFATINTYLNKTNILLHNFINKNYTAVSDALYHKAIEITKEQKKDSLDLGYSMHESLKKFKLNWGANDIRCSVKGLQIVIDNYEENTFQHWLPSAIITNWSNK